MKEMIKKKKKKRKKERKRKINPITGLERP